MRSAFAVDWDSVSNYFELPEKRVALSARVPESLKGQLSAIVRLWRIRAVARGMTTQEAEGSIDMTYVIERLLKVGVEGVWAQEGAAIGLTGMPSDDAEWGALERSILKDAAKRSK